MQNVNPDSTDPQQPSAINELRNLKSMVEEVSTSLRSQREILKRRNMSLPPMVLQSLSGIQNDLDMITNNVIADQTELSQLRALADTTGMLNSSLDLNTVLQDAMEIIISLTGAERGYIILKDEETGELEFRIGRDMELIQMQGGSEIKISRTIVNDVLESGEALLADNAYKDPRMQGNVSIANMTLRSVVCVPLAYKEKIVGVVYCDNRLQAGLFDDRVKQLLVAFANQAAVAIENARLYTAIQATLTEITEMKAVIDNVFNSIGSGVITTNAANKVMTFNRSAEQILAQKAARSVGKRLRSVMPKINLDINELVEDVLKNQSRQMIDAELEPPERGRIAVNLKLSPLRSSVADTQGVTILVDDMTEAVEREEMLGIMKRYLPPEMVENIQSIAQLGLGGVRREMTCLFVDVRPITSFPKDTRPQQLMAMLNVYLATATQCIHEAGGVIDKYMGNIIMALFNTQLNPHEDHAFRAVEAALTMRDAFVRLYQELGIDPDPHYYHVGIHTGVATLGNVGSLNRRDFTAIGDTINLSKRLEENAADSQIVISGNGREHIEKHNNGQPIEFRFEERDPIQVKGRTEKTRIYEVFRT